MYTVYIYITIKTNAMTTFTKVSAKNQNMTSTEKKVLLALVNANKPEYFGSWMKANRTNIKVERVSENTFNVQTRIMKDGFFGRDWYVMDFNNVILK